MWLSQKKEVEALKAVNPAWGDEFGQSTVKIRPNLRMIGAAVNDERFMNAQKGPDLVKWEGIAEWYELYTEVKIAYDQLPPNTPQRTALRDWWATETVRLRAGNTYFADFHSRYLQGDEDDGRNRRHRRCRCHILDTNTKVSNREIELNVVASL